MADQSRRRFREGVEDFSDTPKRLEALIASGRCSGVVNFHTISMADGTSKLGMVAGGMTGQDIFDACCVIRRTMMMMQGMVETQPLAEAMSDTLPPADDETTPVNASACQLCARDYWTVLAKCDYRACPKGLFYS